MVSSKGGICTHGSIPNSVRQISVLPAIVSNVNVKETLLKLKQHDSGSVIVGRVRHSDDLIMLFPTGPIIRKIPYNIWYKSHQSTKLLSKIKM